MAARKRKCSATTLLVAALLGSAWALARSVAADTEGRGAPAIALLPLENLSGAVAPLKEVAAGLREHLESRGIDVLDDDVLQEFMARHRIRYTGGIAPEMGRVFAEETGIAAVLVASVDLLDDADPPKIALTARLISSGETASILWMGSVELTGDHSFGLLGLGIVRDPATVRGRAVAELALALEQYWTGRPGGTDRKRATDRATGWDEGRFRPRSFYRSPTNSYEASDLVRVAVLPFANESGRASADLLVSLHFVRALSGLARIEVLEPGVVRQALLQARLIQTDGLSLPQADLLRSLLDVDLVLTGTVTDYQDYVGPSGNPKVGFSVHGIDAGRRQVAWTSVSYGRGNDRVWFFEAGRVRTAHGVASGLVRGVVGRIVEERSDGTPGRPFLKGSP